MNRVVTLALLVFLATACTRLSRVGGTPTAAPPPATGAMTGLPSGDHLRAVKVGSRERHYTVHVPAAIAASGPAPVVLIFHGGGGNAMNIAVTTHFDEQADRSGFLTVYPYGTGRIQDKILTWNGGTCCGYAVEHDIDDVGFVRALLDDLGTVTAVDTKRIYATGLSNGGIMSYRLACDLSDRLAAIAPVAGTLNYAACAPSQPVSVLHIHGTADAHVPYAGGVGAQSVAGVEFESVPSSIAFWAAYDRCPAKPATTVSGHVTHDAYAPCVNSTAVELYTIDGGLHAWPGGEPGWIGGDAPTMDLDATEAIWEFFATHPRP